MCGIIGQISIAKKIDYNKSSLNKALLKLKSRGPDTSGVFFDDTVLFGHTRLSIIDIDERSNQPLQIDDFIIVYNGEIYNYLEIKEQLKSKGYTFKTASDTEVIVKAYQEWGVDSVKKFQGMWAFCLYDMKKKEFFLSRDPIGQKPLMYYQNKDYFYFSSEIPSLLDILDKKELEIDWTALTNFSLYNFRHIPSPYTAYKDMFKLRPGHSITIKNNIVAIKKYYIPSPAKLKNNKEQIVEKTLKKVINETTISDVPVGLFLSGGVDSSLIAYFLKDTNLQSFSLGASKDDEELVSAKKFSKSIGMKNNEILFDEKKQLKNTFSQIQSIIRQYGEPIFLHQIMYSNLILADMKKKSVKVGISGNGADELFYGYDGAGKTKLLSDVRMLWNSLGFKKIFKSGFSYLNDSPVKLKSSFYEDELKRKKYLVSSYKKFLYKNIFEDYAKEISSKKLIDIFNWIGFRLENEHSITLIGDISGSINGFEVRAPFLDTRLIDVALSLPVGYKVPSYTSKNYNKKILRDILAKNTSRHLRKKKKKGFGYGIQLNDVLRDNKKEIESLLKKTLKDIPIYKEKEVLDLFQNYFDGDNTRVEDLFEIVCICMWFDAFKN